MVNKSFKFGKVPAFDVQYNRVIDNHRQLNSFLLNSVTTDYLTQLNIDMYKIEVEKILAHVQDMRQHVDEDRQAYEDSLDDEQQSIDDETVEGSSLSKDDNTSLETLMTAYRQSYVDLIDIYEDIYQPWVKPRREIIPAAPSPWPRRLRIIAGFIVAFFILRAVDNAILGYVYDRGTEQLTGEENEAAIGSFSYTHFREYLDSRLHLSESYQKTVNDYIVAEDFETAREVAVTFFEQDIDDNAALASLGRTYYIPALGLSEEEPPDWDGVEALILEMESRPEGAILTTEAIALLKLSYIERARSLLEDDTSVTRYEDARQMFEPMVARKPHTTAQDREGLTLFYSTYYEPAKAAFDTGSFIDARTQFDELLNRIAEAEDTTVALANYLDTKSLLFDTYYVPAQTAMQNDDWATARTELEALIALTESYNTSHHKNSTNLLFQTIYEIADDRFNTMQYLDARTELEGLINEIARIQNVDTDAVFYRDILNMLYATYYERAVEQLDASEWDTARNELDMLFDIYASYEGVERNLANFDGDDGTAQFLYHDTYYLPGEIALTEDDYDTAIELLQIVYGLDSGHRSVVTLLSQAYYEAGKVMLEREDAGTEDERITQLDSAIQHFEDLLRLSPGFNDAPSLLASSYYEQASIYSQREDWDTARVVWGNLYQLNRLYADVETQYRLAYYTPAQQTLTKAISRIPDDETSSIDSDMLEQIVADCELSREGLGISAPIELTAFRDTQTLIYESIYCEVQVALLVNDLERALTAIEELNALSPYYRNMPSIYSETLYALGSKQVIEQDWEPARKNLAKLLGREPYYLDAPTLYREAYYRPAKTAFDSQQWMQARSHLLPLIYGDAVQGILPIDPDYKDSYIMFKETYYTPASTSFEQQQWEATRQFLRPLINGTDEFDPILLPPIDPNYRDVGQIFAESYYIPAVSAYEMNEWTIVRDELFGLRSFIANLENVTVQAVNYGAAPQDLKTMLLESHYRPAVAALDTQDFLLARQLANDLIQLVVLYDDDLNVTQLNANYGESPTIRAVLYDSYYNRTEDLLSKSLWDEARNETILLLRLIANNESIELQDVNYRDVQSLIRNTYYEPAIIALEREQWEESRNYFNNLFSLIESLTGVPANQAAYLDARSSLYETYHRPTLAFFNEGDWVRVQQQAYSLLNLLSIHKNLAPSEVNFGDVSAGEDIQTLLRESYYIPGTNAIDQANWLIARTNLRTLFTIAPDFKDVQDKFSQSYLIPAQHSIAAEDWSNARDNLIEFLEITSISGTSSAGDLLIQAHVIPAQQSIEAEDWHTAQVNLVPIISPQDIFDEDLSDIYRLVYDSTSEENKATYVDLYRQTLIRPVENLIATGDNEAARDALQSYLQSALYDNQQYFDLLISSYSVPFQNAIQLEDWVTAANLYLELVGNNPNDNTIGLILEAEPNLKLQLANDRSGYLTQISMRDVRQISNTFGNAINDLTGITNNLQYTFGTSDGLIMVNNVLTHETTAIIKTPHGRIRDVVMSPLGSWVGSVSVDGILHLWDITTGNETQSIVAPDQIILSSVVTASDEIITGSNDGTLLFWSLSGTGYESHTQLNFENAIMGLYLSDDESILAVAEDTGHISIIMLTDNTITASVDFGSAVYDVAITTDGSRFAVVGQQNNIVVWDVAGNELQRIAHHSAWVRSVTFTFDNQYLLTVSDDSSLMIWNMESNRLENVVRLDNIQPRAVMVSPDTLSIIVGGVQNNNSTGILAIWKQRID